MRFLFTLLLTILMITGHSQQLLSERKTAFSMANGGSTSNSAGIESLFANPAGLYESKREIYAGVENLYEIPELSIFRAGFCFKSSKSGAFGFKLSQFGTGKYINQEFGILYSMKLFKQTVIGIEFDLLHTRIQEYGRRTHFNFEIGFQQKFNSKITLGVSIYGPYAFSFSNNHKIPTILVAGIKYSISKELDFLIEVEKHSQYALNLIFALNYQLLDILKLKIATTTGKAYGNLSGGFDIKVKKWLQLSLGLSYDQLPGLSSALGLRFNLL